MNRILSIMIDARVCKMSRVRSALGTGVITVSHGASLRYQSTCVARHVGVKSCV